MTACRLATCRLADADDDAGLALRGGDQRDHIRGAALQIARPRPSGLAAASRRDSRRATARSPVRRPRPRRRRSPASAQLGRTPLQPAAVLQQRGDAGRHIGRRRAQREGGFGQPAGLVSISAARAASPVSASMRRTPAATAPRETILNRPISPVRRTWVPPQARSNRTPLSPRPVVAHARRRAPHRRISRRTGPWRRLHGLIGRHQPGRRPRHSARMTRVDLGLDHGESSRRERLGWVKSKRSRSGATSEPFWVTWSPRRRRSASCSRWVARVVGADGASGARRPRAARPHRRRCSVPSATGRDGRTGRRASSGCRVTAMRRPSAPRSAGVAHLAAGFAIEGRLVER